MKLSEWAAWLEGDLWTEVHGLVRRHEVFRSWNEILDIATQESKSNGLFHAWVADNYVQALAAGIRRISEDSRRSRSLVRFLRDVERNNDVLTREWWLSRWSLGDPSAAYVEQFDRVADGHDRISRAVVQRDREAVTQACDRVKGYVDAYVAHLDRHRSAVTMPKFGDAHSAVATVYAVFHKWYQWIVNVSLGVPLVEYWEHVLATPWITENQADQVYQRRNGEAKALEAELR